MNCNSPSAQIQMDSALSRFIKASFIGICLIFGTYCTPPSSSPVQNQNPLESTQKVLSLHPAMTETLYILGVQDQLMGRSTYCLFPAEAQALPSFGTSLTPNYEAIARHQPHLVLTDQSMGIPTKSLRRISPILQLPWLTLSDVVQSIQSLGRLTRSEKKANILAERFKTTFNPVSTPQSPTLLVLMEGSIIEKGQLWFIRKDSLHGAAIEAAGFLNAAPSAFKGPPSLSLETLLNKDPDLILLISSQAKSSEQEQKWIDAFQVLPSLKAVQKKRIGVLSGENLLGVGPKILDLVDLIRQKGRSLLHQKTTVQK